MCDQWNLNAIMIWYLPPFTSNKMKKMLPVVVLRWFDEYLLGISKRARRSTENIFLSVNKLVKNNQSWTSEGEYHREWSRAVNTRGICPREGGNPLFSEEDCVSGRSPKVGAWAWAQQLSKLAITHLCYEQSPPRAEFWKQDVKIALGTP